MEETRRHNIQRLIKIQHWLGKENRLCVIERVLWCGKALGYGEALMEPKV